MNNCYYSKYLTNDENDDNYPPKKMRSIGQWFPLEKVISRSFISQRIYI